MRISTIRASAIFTRGNLLGQSLALFSRVRLTRSGCSDKLRRRPQVLKEQAWAAAEAAAANELPEEVKEVLEAEHDRSVQRDSNRFVDRTL
jgi:hypothetical protein